MADGLTSKVGIIKLDIAETVIIEDLKLRLVCLGDIGEVFLIARIDVFRVRSSLLVAHVIPLGRCKCQFTLMHSLFGYGAFKIVPLVDVGAPSVLDLASTDDAFDRLVAVLGEGGNVGHVRAENLDPDVLDFFEAVEAGEEAAPEHSNGVSVGAADLSPISFTVTPILPI